MSVEPVRHGEDHVAAQVAPLWEMQVTEVRLTADTPPESLVLVRAYPVRSAYVLLEPEGVDGEDCREASVEASGAA
jgi:hypothetical protein